MTAMELEKIIWRLHRKVAQIVVGGRSATLEEEQNAKPDNWFNLEHIELEDVKEKTRPWKQNPLRSLSIEVSVHLNKSGPHQKVILNNNENDAESRELETNQKMVLEQWTLSFDTGAAGAKTDSTSVYKRLIVLIRSVFAFLRLMPAHSLCRSCRRSRNHLAKIRCEIQAEPFAKERMGASDLGVFTFGERPVKTPLGSLSLSVAYRKKVRLELSDTELLDSHIISNYFKDASDPHALADGSIFDKNNRERVEWENIGTDSVYRQSAYVEASSSVGAPSGQGHQRTRSLSRDPRRGTQHSTSHSPTIPEEIPGHNARASARGVASQKSQPIGIPGRSDHQPHKHAASVPSNYGYHGTHGPATPPYGQTFTHVPIRNRASPTPGHTEDDDGSGLLGLRRASKLGDGSYGRDSVLSKRLTSGSLSYSYKNSQSFTDKFAIPICSPFKTPSLGSNNSNESPPVYNRERAQTLPGAFLRGSPDRLDAPAFIRDVIGGSSPSVVSLDTNDIGRFARALQKAPPLRLQQPSSVTLDASRDLGGADAASAMTMSVHDQLESYRQLGSVFDDFADDLQAESEAEARGEDEGGGGGSADNSKDAGVMGALIRSER